MIELANQTNLPDEVVEAFSSAAVTVFREMTQFEALPVSRGMPSEMEGPCVVAAMRLLRSASGDFALIMSVETAERLAELYLPLGTAITEELVNDVAGEFANVIAGQAKTILKGTPYHFLLSHPVVSRSAIAEKQPGVAATFEIDSGQVQLYVNLLPAE